MIHLADETLIAIKAVADHVPRNPRTGKKVNQATIWRWLQRGVRGVKLDSVLIGGQRYTSLEALQSFVERTTAAADGTTTVIASTPSARQKAHDKACRELDEAGIR